MSQKIKIATLGAAVQDVFLGGEALTAQRDVRTHESVEILPLGEKFELEEIVFSTGGGATNAAVTFARQGLAATVLCKVADDLAGREVTNSLKNEGVSTNQIAVDLEGITGYSTILLAPSGERTVLVYRGVSEELQFSDFDWEKLDVDWLYITSLAGNLKLLERAIKWAEKNNVKVALDPGSRELQQADAMLELLKMVTVLKANKEEISRLFKGNTAIELLRAGAEFCPFVVITDGPKGSYATDGLKAYHAGSFRDVKVKDRTGAGDAFGSGLVAALARGEPLEAALTLGSANSTAVVQHIGAKHGILHYAALAPMPVISRSL